MLEATVHSVYPPPALAVSNAQVCDSCRAAILSICYWPLLLHNMLNQAVLVLRLIVVAMELPLKHLVSWIGLYLRKVDQLLASLILQGCRMRNRRRDLTDLYLVGFILQTLQAFGCFMLRHLCFAHRSQLRRGQIEN